jgi:hypothetical protein
MPKVTHHGWDPGKHGGQGGEAEIIVEEYYGDGFHDPCAFTGEEPVAGHIESENKSGKDKDGNGPCIAALIFLFTVAAAVGFAIGMARTESLEKKSCERSCMGAFKGLFKPGLFDENVEVISGACERSCK